MYSSKSVGPRIDPWESPALTGYSSLVVLEGIRLPFPYRTTQSNLLLRKEEIRPNICPQIPAYQHAKPCQKPWYIKCHSSSRPRLVKSPSNSIRYKCKKICSWSRRPNTILEIRKKPHFSKWSTILLFTGFSKNLLTTAKKTNWMVVFCCRPFPNILTYRDNQWNLPTIWKTRLLQTHIEEFS